MYFNTDQFTRKRWLVLILYGIINLCVGSYYAWSVFAGPLPARLDANNISLAYSVATIIAPIPIIIGGVLTRKFGTRKLLFASGVIFGLGMFLSGCAVNAIWLILSYGLGVGMGQGLAYDCTVSGSVEMFPDKRGLAGGVAAATYGCSSVIIPPIANRLIEAFGVMTTLKILAIVFLILICLCALFVVECPAGFVPKGWTPPTGTAAINGHNYNWKQMLSTPIFYAMLLLLMCGAISGVMTISQASSLAQNLVGMSAASAAVIVSVLSAFNAAGRIVSGALSDKIGRINTLTIMLCVSALGIILLAISTPGNKVKFVIGIAAIGMGFGSFLGVYPGFTADQFGQKHQSINYGLMFTGLALAALIGPSMAETAYTNSGSYHTAFLIAGILCVAGLMLTVLYRKLEQQH